MEQALDQTAIGTFLDALASAQPVPGGGAASALTGAMGAALVSMVCNLTLGRPRYAAVEVAMREILASSEEARRRLVSLGEEDARVYGSVSAAYKLPRSTDEERAVRKLAIQSALKLAVAPPLAVMAACRALVPLSLQVAAHGNPNVVSDAGAAGELAAAGVRTAILNVRINLAEIEDQKFVAEHEKIVASAEDGLDDELDRIVGVVRAKLAPKARR